MMRKTKCMADGGVLLANAGAKETAEQMLARMNAKYGLGDSGKPQAQQPPPPAQDAPQSRPPPQLPAQGGLAGKAVEAIGRRNEELKKAANYAHGGILPVIGRGTETSDSVPAIVAGQKVRLSNGEGAAILPARTMRNEAAVRAIEGIIEATNGKPPLKNKKTDGMAYGGIAGKRRMASGGVIDPGEQNSQMTNYVVPTRSPTAQDIYKGASLSGIAGALKPYTWKGAQVTAPSGTVGGNLSNSGVEDRQPGGTLQNVGPAFRQFAEVTKPAYDLSPSVNALKTTGAAVGNLFADSARASQEGTTYADARAKRIAAAAPIENTEARTFGAARRESDRPVMGSAPAKEVIPLRAGIGDTGNANINPQTGIMAFTDKTFDPAKQKLEPGVGAITNPRTGKTILLAPPGGDMSIAGGPHNAASGPPPFVSDAYGNNAALTNQLKAGLAGMRAESGRAPEGFIGQIPDSRAADSARFDKFLRSSTADSVVRDLARGGGTARANSGKIAALNASQGILSAEESARTAREIAAANEAGRLAAAAEQRRTHLANTDLAGKNQLAVEYARQSGPEKVLLATRMQGEVEDANARREARQGLLSAIDVGNPTAIEKAWRKGIAAGIVNPERQEKPPTPYRFHADPMGNGIRVNEATGETDVLDRATNTWKPVSAMEPAPRDPAKRKTGQTYLSPNGPMTWRGTGWEPAQAR